MEIAGILSLVFSIIGLIASYWYVGAILCLVSIILGIFAVTDDFTDKKFPTAGILLSVLGIVMSVYFAVSDLDSGKLLVQADKFKKQEKAEEVNDDFMRFHKEGWEPNQEDVESASNEPLEEKMDNKEEKSTPYWIHDGNDKEIAEREYMQESVSVAVQPEKIVSEKNENESKTTVIEKGTLYKDENFSVSFSGIEKRDIHNGYDVNFEVENFTNRTINVQLRETSINGYMVNASLNIEVAPNKKGAGGALIFGDDSERTPYNSVNNIETKFHMFYDTDFTGGYDTENVVVMGN